jgi:uncharacterized protein with GYD domain
MPKYLIEASYTPEGLKGLQKDKASGRVAAITKAIEALGGKFECMYFCLGENDAIVIVDAPDIASLAALGIAASSTGLARTKATALLTIEETDQALAKSVAYKAPGKGSA